MPRAQDLVSPLFFSTALALVLTSPALAQQLGSAAAEDNMDILVTAQKREQRLSDVPVTVTAFSGQTLREIGVTRFDQLSAFVPGLNVQEQSPNNPGFVIRGVTSDTGSSQGAPAVTIFLNGVDVSRSRGSYFELYDLERVEVVKGPQATLFGTAAAVGAISAITNKPQAGTSAEIRGGLGNFNQRLLDGFVNFGSETLAARLAFAVRTRDGVVENIAGRAGSQTPGGPRVDDLNGQGQYSARLSVRYTRDDLTIDLIGTYDGQRAPGTAFKSGTFAPTGGDTSPFSFAEIAGSPFSAQVLGNDQPSLTRNVYDINLTGTYSLPSGVEFTQVFGWRNFDSLEVFDADGTQAWYLEFAEDARGEQFSSESRFSFEGERWRGFAGVNWFHETGSQRVPFSSEEGTFLQCAARLVPGLPCIDAAGVVQAARATALLTRGAATVLPYSSEFRNSANIDIWSAFADVTFLPVPTLELTVGGRLLIEDRESGFFARVPNTVITRGPLIPTQVDTRGETLAADGNFQAFLPRANLLWRANDKLNLYATWSKGRRSPVVQLDAAPGGRARRTDVAAETLTNYEVGLKYASQRVTANLGAYLMTYNDFQVALVRPGLPNQTVSAGGATNKGIEAFVTAQLNDSLQLFANGNWIDAQVDEDPRFPTFSGDRFRLQSEWQGSAGGTVSVPLGQMELFATPTVSYRSSVFFELPNNPVTSQGPVTLVNLRAGLRDVDGRWEILGTASNLLNTEYVLDAGNTGGAFGIPTFIRGLPRLFGLEAVYRF